ncbi:hypothetical protein ABXS75_13555 [Roseburia hominis]
MEFDAQEGNRNGHKRNRETPYIRKHKAVCNEAFGGMGGGKDLTDEEIRKGAVHSPDMRVHSPDERKTAVIFTDMIRKKKREKRNEKPFFELQWLK